MLWFALGIIAVAGILLIVLRLWAGHEQSATRRIHSADHPRPVAPDDDEEFLRSLTRKRD